MPEQQEDWNQGEDVDHIITVKGWLGGKYDHLEEELNKKPSGSKKGMTLLVDFWLTPEAKEKADQGLLIQDVDTGDWISVDERKPVSRYSYSKKYRGPLL